MEEKNVFVFFFSWNATNLRTLWLWISWKCFDVFCAWKFCSLFNCPMTSSTRWPTGSRGCYHWQDLHSTFIVLTIIRFFIISRLYRHSFPSSFFRFQCHTLHYFFHSFSCKKIVHIGAVSFSRVQILFVQHLIIYFLQQVFRASAHFFDLRGFSRGFPIF